MSYKKRYDKIRRILDHRQPDLTVVMDNVHKPHNVAAILRTCDAVGIPMIHAIVDRNLFDVRRRAASGAHKWVEVKTYNQVEDAYGLLRDDGFRILTAQCAGDSQDFRTIDYTQSTAIVVGMELDGLTSEAINQADGSMTVPTVGMVDSLNVSVATAVILFEAERQRRQAGFYDAPRLDKETYTRLLFEFTHPTVSAYCKRHSLPYPDINEKGEIISQLR
jgi:tRNA (guanosine-2'-O-)-methyltransferase